MADNYLEYHREDYERRKALWLAKKQHKKLPKRRSDIEKPHEPQ